MVRNTFRLAGSLILGILLIAALAGIINTFRLQPAAQPSGAPLPSGTGAAPSLPEATPQATPARLSDSFNGLIAFQSERDGNAEIYVMDADGNRQTNLTSNTTQDIVPRWSPDGTRIAFFSDRSGQMELYAMDADGKNLQQLTQTQKGESWLVGPLEWSPDGARLLVIRESVGPEQKDNEGHTWHEVFSARLYLVYANGSGGQFLVEDEPEDTHYGPYAFWSPDGARITATASGDSSETFRILSADGSGSVDIASTDELVTYPIFPGFSWSPEGSRLAYAGVREGFVRVTVANNDGTFPETLWEWTQEESGQPTAPGDAHKLKEIGSLKWSPDGSKLLFLIDEDGDGEGCWTLYLLQPDVTGAVRVPGLCPAAVVPFASWTPDGQWILLTASEGSDSEKAALMAVNATQAMQDPASVTRIRLTEPTGQDSYPQAQPPSRLLAIEPQPTVIPGLTRTEVVTYTVQEGDTVYAIADKFDLRPETILWANTEVLGNTPDVLMVGMILNILPIDGVYHRSTEGDTLENVAAAYGVSPEAILSWPGNRLDPSDPVIEPGMMILIPGGRRPFTGAPTRPASNGLIAFTLTRDDNTDIYAMNPDGSGMHNLTNDPGADWGHAWSPDGTRLAFISNRTGVDEIFVINADGSGLAQLTHDTHPHYTHENESGVVDPNTPLYPSYEAPHWSPDGQTLATVLRTGSPSEDSNFLALIKADGSDVSYIRGAFIDPQWSPDGALLAFMREYGYDEEIWILDPATVQWDGTAQMTKVLEASDPNEYWESLRWSPDGRQLAFSAIREEGNRYTVELRSLERNGWTHSTLYAFEPFESEGGASSGDFAWSPDGSRLALVMPGPKDKPIANQIFLINTDGSGSVTLGVNLDVPFHLTWSPDGRYMLFEGGPLELEQDENGDLQDENGNLWAIVKDDRAVWVLDVEAALHGEAVPERLTSETGRVSWPEWQAVP